MISESRIPSAFVTYLKNRIKSEKHIRIDEQEREVLNIVNNVLISAAKSVLKGYKVIWDESV